MKSNLRLSNRLSNFRFSLASIGPLRSPVSPITPTIPPQPQHNFPTLATISDSRPSSSPTVAGSNNDDIDVSSNTKTTGMKVTTFEPPTPHYTVTNSLLTPRALPSPTPTNLPSPITPWHATFHRNAATIDQETRYLKQSAHLRHARIILTFFLVALSATTTALTSDILHRFNTTNLPTSFSLPLWPSNTNTTPTLLTLSTSVITLFLSLATLLIHITPTRSTHTTLKSTLFTATTTLSFLATLTTLIVNTVQSPAPIFSTFISKTLTALLTTTGPHSTTGQTLNGLGSNPKSETIQSFTCLLSHTASSFTSSAKDLSLPGPTDAAGMTPTGFMRICTESQVSLGLVVVLCVVAGVGVAVAGAGWWVERGIEACRGEREVMSLRSGKSRGGSSSGMSTGGKGPSGKVVEVPVFVEKGDLETGRR